MRFASASSSPNVMVSPDPDITIAGRSGYSAAHRPGYYSVFSSVMAAEPTGPTRRWRKRAVVRDRGRAATT